MNDDLKKNCYDRNINNKITITIMIISTITTLTIAIKVEVEIGTVRFQWRRKRLLSHSCWN